jgi:hypothetical protein
MNVHQVVVPAKRVREGHVLANRYVKGLTQTAADIKAGPAGKEAEGLAAQLRNLTPDTEGALVAYVVRAEKIRALPPDQRFALLMLTARAIARARVRAGLPGVVDALPGSSSTFQKIREVLA